MDKLNALETIARDLTDGNGNNTIEDIQSAQRAYFNELQENGSRWRVTDFITLGSPLAHAEVLLALDRKDLDARFEAREIATCLPTLEIGRHDPPKRLFSYPSDKEE